MEGSQQSSRGPRVWALLGHRTGDNLQVEAVADALGWPAERKRVAWPARPARWTPCYGRRTPSLAPLAPEARAAFAPPWPDLVIAVGWRSVPVARWIRAQSGCRLVHIGRPRAPLTLFDLVVTTPQYGLPPAPNVLCLAGPLTGRSAAERAAAAGEWRDRLAHLPRPWTAVLIGGNAPPLRLTDEAAAELGAAVNRMALADGGSVLAAGSPRTPPSAFDTFAAAIAAPMQAHRWGDPGDNPYAGFLGLADRFVVTGDSISMAHEAAATGKPLSVFPLPASGSPGLRLMLGAGRLIDHGPLAPLGRRLVAGGWIYAPRDPGAYFDGLLASGRASLLGAPAPAPARAPEAADDLARTVQAIRALMKT